MRVVRVRTGVVLDRHGGALQKMLLPFRLGVGGPVAGGRQPMPWIHLDDVIGIYLAAIDDERWSGPFNATAPAAGQQPRVLQGARPRPAPPGDRARARLRASRPSTAAWPSSSSRARTPSRAAPPSSDTASGIPTSTRRCAPRSGHLTTTRAVGGKVRPVTAGSQDRYEPLPGLLEIPGFLIRKIPPRARQPGRVRRRHPARRRRRRARPQHPGHHRVQGRARGHRGARRARAGRRCASPSSGPSCACARAAARPRAGSPARGRSRRARRWPRSSPPTWRPTPSAASRPASSPRASAASSASGSRAGPPTTTPRSTSASAPVATRAWPSPPTRHAATTQNPSSIGYPYRAIVDFGSGRFAYCKISGRPGEGGLTGELPVRVPRACGGS